MKERYVIYGAAILALLALAYTLSGFLSTDAGQAMPVQDASDALHPGSIGSGSTGPGDVSIELTPHAVSGGQLRVDLAANTHSVSLGAFDLKQATTLEYDGKTVHPSQAPGLSGHHASGTLLFDVDGNSRAFTIRIRGIPKVDERVFSWQG